MRDPTPCACLSILCSLFSRRFHLLLWPWLIDYNRPRPSSPAWPFSLSVIGGRRCFLLLLASEQAATEDRVFDSDHPPAIVVKETQKVLVYGQLFHRFTKFSRHVVTDFFGNPRWSLIKYFSVWFTSLLITHRITHGKAKRTFVKRPSVHKQTRVYTTRSDRQ
jgi:hypothetical protein